MSFNSLIKFQYDIVLFFVLLNILVENMFLCVINSKFMFSRAVFSKLFAL